MSTVSSEKICGIKQLGPYRLLRKIGEGGMGIVFLAEDPNAGRKCVIKALTATNKDLLARFKREAVATGKLNHPNIVTAYTVGEDNGIHYYAMEYCDGVSLDIVLDSTKTAIPWKIAVEIVKQVACGLNYAHEHGVIHRDIKPANIIVCKPSKVQDGDNPVFPKGSTVKILDLGLSKIVEGKSSSSYLTQTGTSLGTPYYMSPEQILGEKSLDCRADIYSLGASFYELVTGKIPFDGDTPFAVTAKHLREKARNPQELNPNIPTCVSKIIQIMMEKKPDNRYVSCKDLINDLEKIGNSIRTAHETTGNLDPIVASARRNEKIERLKRIEKRGSVVNIVFLVCVLPLLMWFIYYKVTKTTEEQVNKTPQTESRKIITDRQVAEVSPEIIKHEEVKVKVTKEEPKQLPKEDRPEEKKVVIDKPVYKVAPIQIAPKTTSEPVVTIPVDVQKKEAVVSPTTNNQTTSKTSEITSAPVKTAPRNDAPTNLETQKTANPTQNDTKKTDMKPIKVSTTPPLKGDGKLYVTSDPAGASILVEQEGELRDLRSKTPSLVKLPNGEAIIVLRISGYEDKRVLYKVGNLITKNEAILLERIKFCINLESESFDGFMVFVNGRPVVDENSKQAVIPCTLRLPYKNFIVGLAKDGFADTFQKKSIKGTSEETISIKGQPRSGISNLMSEISKFKGLVLDISYLESERGPTAWKFSNIDNTIISRFGTFGSYLVNESSIIVNIDNEQITVPLPLKEFIVVKSNSGLIHKLHLIKK